MTAKNGSISLYCSEYEGVFGVYGEKKHGNHLMD